ncbi:hypothetical protein LXL04_004211 [Taraxacum kok-saghyz]
MFFFILKDAHNELRNALIEHLWDEYVNSEMLLELLKYPPATLYKPTLTLRLETYIATGYSFSTFIKNCRNEPRDVFSDISPDAFAILTGRRRVKYDFADREWFGKLGITLERYTDESIAALGRVVIQMLSSAFSSEGFATIFTLAYHLKAPGCRFRAFIFNSDESLQVTTTTDQRYSDYSKEVNVRNEIAATSNPTREAAVYSYVAASLFWLFSKPASYYVKTWSHVLNGFTTFYTEPMAVILPVPTVASVENLKRYFSIEQRAKVTLYRFLYMSNSDDSYKGFKLFLYDNLLKNTGLHIVSIVEQLSDVLNCSIGSIVATMDIGEMKNQVRCLRQVLKMLNENDVNHRLNMWRYGRIFDEAFMSDLQTKS